MRVAYSFFSCSCESASEAGAAAAIPATLPEPAAEDDGVEQRGKGQEKIEHGRPAIIFFFLTFDFMYITQ